MKKRLYKQNAVGENVSVHITLIDSVPGDPKYPRGDPTIATMSSHINKARVTIVYEMPSDLDLLRTKLAEKWAMCPTDESVVIACGGKSICQAVYDVLKMK